MLFFAAEFTSFLAFSKKKCNTILYFWSFIILILGRYCHFIFTNSLTFTQALHIFEYFFKHKTYEFRRYKYILNKINIFSDTLNLKNLQRILNNVRVKLIIEHDLIVGVQAQVIDVNKILVRYLWMEVFY